MASGRMTIWEHLAEFRTRLIRCAYAVAIGAVAGWFLYEPLLEFLTQPYKQVEAGLGQTDTTLYATSLLDPFTVRIETSVYIGLALAMPVLLWQIWRFVTPGLYPHEKRYAIPFVASATFLFAFGAALAYLTLPAAIGFLLGVAGGNVKAIPTVDSYLKLNLFMMLSFGFGFEVPVLIVALQLVGAVTPKRLLGWWRQAIVITAVVAAVITPSGDPISMMALAVPMIIFYFMAIAVGAMVLRVRRRKKVAAAAGEGGSEVQKSKAKETVSTAAVAPELTSSRVLAEPSTSMAPPTEVESIPPTHSTAVGEAGVLDADDPPADFS